MFMFVFDGEPANLWIITWIVIFAVTCIAICCKKSLFHRWCRCITLKQKNADSNIPTIREQLNSVISMTVPYFKESKSGRIQFFLMIVMVILYSVVSVLFSYASKNFYDALNSGDAARFHRAMMKYASLLFIYAPVIAAYTYQRDRVSLHWREWMTERTLKLYSQNRVYYHLERKREIDNPDQRISEDVNSFCSYSLILLVLILKNSIDFVSFSIILYSIMPQLFVVIVIYVTLGTIGTFALGLPLISLNYQVLQREADFRFGLVRLRENAESVAFYAGEELEFFSLVTKFFSVIQTRMRVIYRQFSLEFFTNIYFYMTWILPVGLVAPMYFSGDVELGSVTQAREAFYSVVNDISIIISQFADISKFSAGISRLMTFYDAIRDVDNSRTNNMPLLCLETTDKPIHQEETLKNPKIKIMLLMNNEAIMAVSDLTLMTPNYKRTLIRGLNFSLKTNEHLLIVGGSGCGKSSLLRCIAGLWNAGEGYIERPPNDHIYFLPQRPYCALGSLRSQILYPSVNVSQHPFSDEHLLALLDLVDLKNLTNQVSHDGDPFSALDVIEDWSNMLSLGEQQRLAFARVFINRPRLIILDEATSALDMNTEKQMYKLLETMSKSNGFVNSRGLAIPYPAIHDLTYVSVGHRPSLLAFHHKKLHLQESKHSVDLIDKQKAAQIAEDAATMMF